MDENGNLKDGDSPLFLNFRPAYATPTLPAALAHVAFANFLDVFRGRKDDQLDKEDALFFSKLAFKCSRYYKDEAVYRDAVAELWNDYVGMEFINELVTRGGTLCDFAALDAKLGMFASSRSESESDPGMQYVWVYWLQIGDRNRFKLVIEHIGPFVRISAVYVLDKLCCMPLTPFINVLLLQGFDSSAALEGARLCKATKVSLQELADFYIPYPLQSSKFVPRPLAGKLVFVVGQEEQDTVVKYVQGTYGDAVHRAWAGEGDGLAPQLYAVKQLPGGWLEVKMEFLGGEWRSLHGHPQAEELRTEVVKVLDKAHKIPVTRWGGVGVHGDARDENVMVRICSPGGQVEVKFIDFDWAAVEGDGRYPYFMNHFGVNWPGGASAGQIMLQKHDKELLSMSQGEQTKLCR